MSKCLVCQNDSTSCETFYSFPENKILRDEWLKSLPLKECDIENGQICTQHFLKTDFSNGQLLSTAVPSIFKERNIENESPTLKFSDEDTVALVSFFHSYCALEPKNDNIEDKNEFNYVPEFKRQIEDESDEEIPNNEPPEKIFVLENATEDV